MCEFLAYSEAAYLFDTRETTDITVTAVQFARRFAIPQNGSEFEACTLSTHIGTVDRDQTAAGGGRRPHQRLPPPVRPRKRPAFVGGRLPVPPDTIDRASAAGYRPCDQPTLNDNARVLFERRLECASQKAT